jgi:hypothetical protein
MEIWEPKPPGTLWACYRTPLPLPFIIEMTISISCKRFKEKINERMNE